MDTSNIVEELKCLLIFTLHLNDWEVYDSSGTQIHSPSQRSSSREEGVHSELFLGLRSAVIGRAECCRGSSSLTWPGSKEGFCLPRRTI